jgi:opacity protein-like surface antigen
MNRLPPRRAVLTLPLLAILAAGAVTPVSADVYDHKGTFVLGGGWNNPTGKSGDYFDGGGTIFFAGGRHLNESTALQIEYSHHWLGIDPSVIQRASSDSLQFDNAYASMWSVTLNGVYHHDPRRDVVPWITGGVGYYKRNLVLTKNSYFYVPPFFDPWWGWIGGGWVPGESVTGSHADTGFGFNVGVGFDLKIDSGASLYVDARWHHAYMPGVNMDVIPISFGVRW